MDPDDFDRWLTAFFMDGQGLKRHAGASPPQTQGWHLTPEQVRRLIARLHALSGHAPGALPAAELEAIREGNERRKRYFRERVAAGPVDYPRQQRDVDALLAHADAITADLAAAEGALHDLTSPQSGEANAAYLRGVQDERRRCVEWLTGRARGLRSLVGQAPRMSDAARELYVARVVALEDAALALESPPAPAAAPEGE